MRRAASYRIGVSRPLLYFSSLCISYDYERLDPLSIRTGVQISSLGVATGSILVGNEKCLIILPIARTSRPVAECGAQFWTHSDFRC